MFSNINTKEEDTSKTKISQDLFKRELKSVFKVFDKLNEAKKKKIEDRISEKCSKFNIISEKNIKDDIIRPLDLEMEPESKSKKQDLPYLIKKNFMSTNRNNLKQYNKCIDETMEPFVKAHDNMYYQLSEFEKALNDCFHACSENADVFEGDCNNNCIVNYRRIVLPQVKEHVVEKYNII